MSDEPATETGAAVDGLIAAVRADMSTATAKLAEVAALFAAVARRGRGVNGLAVACSGWRGLLESMQEEITKEVSDVERKYRGDVAPEIREHVDHDHAARVIAARAATTEPEE